MQVLGSIAYKFRILAIVQLMAIFVVVGCGDEGGDNHDDGFCEDCGPGEHGGGHHGGGPGTLAVTATADLKGAYGLLVLDEDQGGSLRLMDKHNKIVDTLKLKNAPKFEHASESEALSLHKKDDKTIAKVNGKTFLFPKEKNKLNLTENGESAAMQKIDESTGEIKDALVQDQNEAEDENAYNPDMKLPRLKTIAVSPTKEVYLHFENSFIYKDAPPNEDPWNMSNGYQCQIFKIKGGILDDLLTQEPDRNNLECVDNAHFIDSWRSFQNGVFQFDSSGNLYYPGSIPNDNKTVVYRVTRDGSDSSEVINANICVENFLITPSGGIFYTGQTCNDDNHGGGGGGFFRYVAPGDDGQILEIARDWWNFIFDTSVTESNNDLAVFFGPDPRNANTASWDSACLFNFNPTQSDPTQRVSEVITCGSNIWDWMELRRSVDVTDYGEGYHNYSGNSNDFAPSLSWKKEYKRRCESKDEVFAGGGSQISSIKQDSTGEIYVIGNIRKKVAGTIKCSVEFRGPHCVISGEPTLLDSNDTAYTSASCIEDAGTWTSKGRCTNGTNKEEGCTDHSRTWTPGFCANPDYTTKAACEAVTGCSNRYFTNESDCTTHGYNWGNLVWRTGRCSTDQDKYETQAACEGAAKSWEVDDWSGSCTSTDSEENASLYDNDKYSCIPEWQTETVWYDNVSNDLCTTAENGDRSTWWNWDHKDNNYAQTATDSRSAYTDLSAKFLVNGMNCQESNESGGSGNWTQEYSALAKVNTTKKSLELISLESEKAINLWLVENKPYYSSYDAKKSMYLLNGLNTNPICVDTSITDADSCTTGTWSERMCQQNYTTKETCQDADFVWHSISPYTIMENFEVYNLAESGTANFLFADGLDFANNQYKFGTIDIVNKSLSLKEGLTGVLKTIVILPK